MNDHATNRMPTLSDFSSLSSFSQFRLTNVVRDIVTHLGTFIRLERKMWANDPTFAASIERCITLDARRAI